MLNEIPTTRGELLAQINEMKIDNMNAMIPERIMTGDSRGNGARWWGCLEATDQIDLHRRHIKMGKYVDDVESTLSIDCSVHALRVVYVMFIPSADMRLSHV